MTALRISINCNRIEGPYGGGNQFASALEKHLVAKGHMVCRALVPNLDIILIVSSKWHKTTTAYTVAEAAAYCRAFPRTVVVLRVNTADEPRGADLGINKAMLEAAKAAHYAVFVSDFVRGLYLQQGFPAAMPAAVIRNGADEEIFHHHGRAAWTPGQKMRIVTHHWSANFMKGFDFYERLDQMLGQAPWHEQFEFTCIGNVSVGVEFANARRLPPLYGKELAEELKRHHVYITAARNEPAGNHYIEAMRCGLPVLYLRSGSLPEYCAPYGVAFTHVDFADRLQEMRDRYAELSERVLSCPFSAGQMAEAYENLFARLTAERRQIKPAKTNAMQRLMWQLKNMLKRLQQWSICRLHW